MIYARLLIFNIWLICVKSQRTWNFQAKAWTFNILPPGTYGQTLTTNQVLTWQNPGNRPMSILGLRQNLTIFHLNFDRSDSSGEIHLLWPKSFLLDGVSGTRQEYDLSQHPSINVMLVVTNNSKNLKYDYIHYTGRKGQFCKETTDINYRCQNIVISKPNLKRLNFELHWLYIPTKKNEGIIFNRCKDRDNHYQNCQLKKAWISCRDEDKAPNLYDKSNPDLVIQANRLGTWISGFKMRNMKKNSVQACVVTYETVKYSEYFTVVDSVKFLIHTKTEIEVPAIEAVSRKFYKRYGGAAYVPDNFPVGNYPQRYFQVHIRHPWNPFKGRLGLRTPPP